MTRLPPYLLQRLRLAWRGRLGRALGGRALSGCGRHLFLERGVCLINPRQMHFGDSVELKRHCVISCSPESDLRLGDRVVVGMGTIIACGDAALHIGSGTGIGAYASIRNADHGLARDIPYATQPMHARPVTIGSGVYIGDRAAIMPGVVIGDGAVIAANSLVIRDVPAQSIVSGVPARVVDSRA